MVDNLSVIFSRVSGDQPASNEYEKGHKYRRIQYFNVYLTGKFDASLKDMYSDV
jgi:hypothetical protein